MSAQAGIQADSSMKLEDVEDVNVQDSGTRKPETAAECSRRQSKVPKATVSIAPYVDNSDSHAEKESASKKKGADSTPMSPYQRHTTLRTLTNMGRETGMSFEPRNAARQHDYDTKTRPDLSTQAASVPQQRKDPDTTDAAAILAMRQQQTADNAKPDGSRLTASTRFMIYFRSNLFTQAYIGA